MNRKIELFLLDPHAYFAYFLEKIIKCVISFISTFHCRMKMRAIGIRYGKNVRFKGNSLFFRDPLSKISVGDNCLFVSSSRFNNRGINHKCILATKSNAEIQIGNKCSFSGVSIVSSCSVVIGNNVLVGANCQIGDRNGHEDRYPQFHPKPVVIKDNVWLGMNVVVMRGVTIGENSIIGANSVVTKDIPANSIAAGMPARVLRELL